MRSVEMSVVDLRTKRDEARARLTQECKNAIENDFAEVIIMGCTAFEGLPEMLQEQLGIPVLDPVFVTFKMAEFLASLKATLNITHSKEYMGKLELGYAAPDRDELKKLKS